MESNVKSKKPFYKKWWFWLLAIIIIGGVYGSSGDNEKDKYTKDTSKATVKEQKEQEKKEEKEDIKVTYENFINIKMGMKQEDVMKILGKGQEESSSEVSGIKTVIYTWNGEGVSNMNVTIQNGVVTGKAQIGLNKTDAKVTLDQYNKIKQGMSYEEVKKIIGDGQIVSQNKVMDSEAVVYSWINKDGTNMNCTFSNGKLNSKAQFNLK